MPPRKSIVRREFAGDVGITGPVVADSNGLFTALGDQRGELFFSVGRPNRHGSQSKSILQSDPRWIRFKSIDAFRLGTTGGNTANKTIWVSR